MKFEKIFSSFFKAFSKNKVFGGPYNMCINFILEWRDLQFKLRTTDL